MSVGRGHAVSLVGFGKQKSNLGGKEYWIIKNSMGNYNYNTFDKISFDVIYSVIMGSYKNGFPIIKKNTKYYPNISNDLIYDKMKGYPYIENNQVNSPMVDKMLKKYNVTKPTKSYITVYKDTFGKDIYCKYHKYQSICHTYTDKCEETFNRFKIDDKEYKNKNIKEFCNNFVNKRKNEPSTSFLNIINTIGEGSCNTFCPTLVGH